MKKSLLIFFVYSTLLCGCTGKQEGSVLSFDNGYVTLSDSGETVSIEKINNVEPYKARLSTLLATQQKVEIHWKSHHVATGIAGFQIYKTIEKIVNK